MTSHTGIAWIKYILITGFSFTQWKDGSDACRYSLRSVNSSNCHDGVDLPLCFEDTAILYGICAPFLVLVSFSFLCGKDHRNGLEFSLLFATKLVGALSFNAHNVM